EMAPAEGEETKQREMGPAEGEEAKPEGEGEEAKPEGEGEEGEEAKEGEGEEGEEGNAEEANEEQKEEEIQVVIPEQTEEEKKAIEDYQAFLQRTEKTFDELFLCHSKFEFINLMRERGIQEKSKKDKRKGAKKATKKQKIKISPVCNTEPSVPSKRKDIINLDEEKDPDEAEFEKDLLIQFYAELKTNEAKTNTKKKTKAKKTKK
ncbi:MAG: hypothetical protein MJ252_09485, partial [archaeon]|nr:hypothetical protein [archaeon]